LFYFGLLRRKPKAGPGPCDELSAKAIFGRRLAAENGTASGGRGGRSWWWQTTVTASEFSANRPLFIPSILAADEFRIWWVFVTLIVNIVSFSGVNRGPGQPDRGATVYDLASQIRRLEQKVRRIARIDR
jgi:hypothetical protein